MMSSVLLMRLQGPMQAWGTQSLFSVRDTTRFPTRSGVIGMLCCAIGKPRDGDLSEFAPLRMGVRVDRPGVVMKDFQTAQDVYKAGDGVSNNPSISNRYYLSDAVFLVGIEGDEAQLRRYYGALRNPRWLLYLGRRAFPPSKPVWLVDGLQTDTTLEEALKTFPYLCTEKNREKTSRLAMILEDDAGSVLQRDWPLSFGQRSFTQRRQTVRYIAVPDRCLEEVENVSE